MMQFLDDIMPKYVIMIINDTNQKKSYLYIKQIKKNEEFFDNNNAGKTDQSNDRTGA